MKICRQCDVEKELSDFVKCRLSYKNICKQCHRENEKSRRNKNIVNIRKTNRKKYKEQNLYEKRMRGEFLKYKYGMTIDEYNKLLRQQNGVCAICDMPETRTRKGKLSWLCVDHSHITGRVRGLLCSSCNTAIGKLKVDNLGIINLQKAIEYINLFN